ncbi:MAG: cytochrome c [Rudaea sp.]|nr:cytochrome c [Rudaea sp.]
MHPIRFITLLACGLLTFNALGAENAAAPGKTVEDLSKTCAACHGADGNGTNAQYPRLAGQYHDYLSRALQEYKTGERKNAIMAGFVSTLSAADIDALSRYYAAMPSKLDDLSHHEQGD